MSMLFLFLFSAPSAAPSSLTPSVTGATSVTLTWGPVPSIGRNGEILGYKVSGQFLTSANLFVSKIQAICAQTHETDL